MAESSGRRYQIPATLPGGPQESLSIKVHSMFMKPHVVEIEVSDTVKILKECIEDVCCHPAGDMSLYTNSGRAMMDDQRISEFDQADISTIMLYNSGKRMEPLPLANPEAIRKLGLVPAPPFREGTRVSIESAFRITRMMMGLPYDLQSSTPVRPPMTRKPLDEPILDRSEPKPQGGRSRLETNVDSSSEKEIEKNSEILDRFEVAKVLKEDAIWYIEQALRVYQEWCTEVPGNGSKLAAHRGNKMRIWADAARWSQDPPSTQITSKAKAQFHGWWVRAAFAMGNSLWLKTEHVDSNVQDPYRLQQWQVNQCRTAIGYKEISTIFATNVYSKNFGAKAMEHARRYQKGAWDDIPPVFFAAPDRLFFKYFRTGWTNDLINLVPSEPESLDRAAYWQTYCRNGLFDALPRSATLHERALALCADDIVFLICQESKLRKTKAPITTIVSKLEEELRPHLARRALSTQAEAHRLGLQGLIQEKVDSITESFRQGYELESDATPIGLELCLQELLAPWYTVTTLMIKGDTPLEIVVYPFGNTYYENRSKASDYRLWVRFLTIYRVEREVGRIRSRILAGQQVSDDDTDLAKAFRRFLESGRKEDMPYIAKDTWIAQGGPAAQATRSKVALQFHHPGIDSVKTFKGDPRTESM
ncbi:hypothetical protein AYL99_01073 [Fonsecaea erecta]|uniref:Ubiquitin-like domain-containing protein n=1 Tax=Fonsecaea erecta TaxID=1367422 RepID=A0A179A0H7_9EURO|nr:hypothetical protein AYL99_01073 [Fonsecaea erecta]OAP65101.1 hypothetical protein AYL99_01073 [Fonsecaea erecta]